MLFWVPLLVWSWFDVSDEDFRRGRGGTRVLVAVFIVVVFIVAVFIVAVFIVFIVVFFIADYNNVVVSQKHRGVL